MAMRALFSCIILISLLVAVITGESKNHILYQKLEDALTGNKTALYEMQEAFFPLTGSARDVVYLHVCVAVWSVQPVSYNNSSCFGGQNNFTYCQRFQWSSSALVDLISVDQLLILDNILSEIIIHVIEHQEYMELPLHIYNLPYDIKEDDILSGLMRLLPWVCILIFPYSVRSNNFYRYVNDLLFPLLIMCTGKSICKDASSTK